MTTFDELFAEHNLTPNERKALVMHLATLRAQKTVEALQDCPLASAPSTPPPAVGEAVPLAEAAERIEKIERAAMIVAGMLPSQDMAHAASRLAKLTSDFRWWWQRVGIAPKAAQPNAELSRAARRADSA